MVKRELGAATRENQVEGRIRPAGLVFATCALGPTENKVAYFCHLKILHYFSEFYWPFISLPFSS